MTPEDLTNPDLYYHSLSLSTKDGRISESWPPSLSVICLFDGFFGTFLFNTILRIFFVLSYDFISYCPTTRIQIHSTRPDQEGTSFMTSGPKLFPFYPRP